MDLEDFIWPDMVLEGSSGIDNSLSGYVPFVRSSTQDLVIDPQLRSDGVDQKHTIDGIDSDHANEPGTLDDTSSIPLEVREFVLSNLPLDEDFLGYVESFRELQASAFRRWRSTPFGVVLSPPRVGISNIVVPALSPPTWVRPSQPNTPSHSRANLDNEEARSTPTTTYGLSSPSNKTSMEDSDSTIENGDRERTVLVGKVEVKLNVTAIRTSDGKLVVQLKDGGYQPAVLFSELYQQNETMNITHYPSSQQGWTGERGNGRPHILYEIRPNQVFHDQMKQTAHERALKRTRKYTYQPWLDVQGRVILNSELKPMRYFAELPEMISTDVKGWYLEALFRLNPCINHDDVIDRMPSTNNTVRPSYRALHQRRARARHIMRITNWQQGVKENDLWERIIDDDLEDWARLSNTTYHLVDLTLVELGLLEELAADPKPDPRKDKKVILNKLQSTLNRAIRAGYSKDHWAIVRMMKRVESWKAL